MSMSEAVKAMLGSPTSVLTTPLLLGFKAHLSCMTSEDMGKVGSRLAAPQHCS